jgi:hypothetical protein
MEKYNDFTIRASFKVHNTWDLSYDELADKLMKTVKKNFLPSSVYGRLKNSFWDKELKSLVYTFKDQEIKVRIRPTCNLNRGTWYQIDSVRVNDEYVVSDENSYKPELELVESNNLVTS